MGMRMWTENAFVFQHQDTLNAFTQKLGAKPFELVRTLGIETTVNAEWYKKIGLLLIE